MGNQNSNSRPRQAMAQKLRDCDKGQRQPSNATVRLISPASAHARKLWGLWTGLVSRLGARREWRAFFCRSIALHKRARLAPLEVRPHVCTRLPQAAQTNCGSGSHSRASSGHQSPLACGQPMAYFQQDKHRAALQSPRSKGRVVVVDTRGAWQLLHLQPQFQFCRSRAIKARDIKPNCWEGNR
jgi:hypothetical protein